MFDMYITENCLTLGLILLFFKNIYILIVAKATRRSPKKVHREIRSSKSLYTSAVDTFKEIY